MSSGFRTFFSDLRKKRIIEILAAFIGGGWLLLEFVHWILVDHYHFSEKTIDVTFVTILGTLIGTLTWRWFSGREKPRKFKPELILIPLVLLITILADINLVFHLKGPERETSPASKWKNSIAVLPFVDMSPQKDQEYFCDGMTEELINRLSNVKGLKVSARTSAFAFKGKAEDIREIGRKLDVQKVLEGSVRKEGGQLRITVQLVNVADSFHLWSETFDKELTKVFSIQDEVALTIADKLKLTLVGNEKIKLVARPTENLEAYTLYLQGRYFWNKRMTNDVKKAIDHFKRAVALDPNFALAYVGLADSYLVLPQFGEFPTSEALPMAKAAVSKALAINDTLAEAHTSLAYIKELEWDYPAAEMEFQRAVKLNPNYPTAHQWYSSFLQKMGRLDESLVEGRRALELDPLSIIINLSLASIFQDRREVDRAIEQCRKALELDPDYGYVRLELGQCLRQKGMVQEAIAELEKANQLYGSSPYAMGDLGSAYAASGDKAKAMEVLSNLKNFLERGYTVTFEIALVYLGLGDRDKAFEWLGKACDDGNEMADGKFSNFRNDARWDSLRQDPRFKPLLKRLHLE